MTEDFKGKSKLLRSLTAFSLVLMMTAPPAFAGGPPYEKNLNRGLKKLHKGDNNSAITYFTKVLTMDPTVFEAYLNRALARQKLKDYEGALGDFEKAIKINPNVVECYLKRGDLYMILGKQSKAVEDYSQAKSLDPKNYEPYLKRARALKFNGNYVKASKDYEAVLEMNPRSMEAREGRADCKRYLNDYDGAIADYRYLLKKYKKRVFPLHLELGEVLKAKGEEKKAGKHFEQVIEYYTKKLDRSRKRGWDYIRRGLAYFELGEKEKALSDLENGVELLPKDAIARHKLAHVLLSSNETEKALKQLDESLKLNGNLHVALIDRSEAYIRLGKYEEAKRDLDKALSIEKDAKGYLNRALANLSIGDSLSAVSDLKQANRLSSTIVESYRDKLTRELESCKSTEDNTVKMALVLQKLALFEMASSDPDSAETTLKQSLAILESKLSANDPAVAKELLLLGMAYQKKGYFLKAEALYRSSLEKLKKGMGNEYKYALFNLEDLDSELMNNSNY